MEKEWGFGICEHTKTGEITRGDTAIGDSHSVTVSLKCSRGSKPIAVHHLHPSGSTKLSERDIKTGVDKKLKFVCVRGGNKVKCYRIKVRT